ncbi:RNA polymerase subunit sigma-70 [Amycolatopsis sp. cg5]|uniref:RNA polymerase subunit sigma-70 n=1 Tax=Amycolatopsis sp. cg5 TaxID=3238802 RepID=UPI0035243BAE
MQDEATFAALVGRHRRELHVHCYRMLGSFTDADDLVQETFLRAWSKRETFDGDAFRAWLYRIATNACLDFLRRTSRQVTRLTSFAEVSWLQPYPDRLLDEIEQPDAVAVARETIELAFLAAIQLLPPKQRATLILRDVLGWSATETAETLALSVASANSALQRARATMREELPARRLDWTSNEASAEEMATLKRFVTAHVESDWAALATLVSEDVRVTMPPHPVCFDGRDALSGLGEEAERMGDWKRVLTTANRMPAAVGYVKRPGDTEYHAWMIDVLRVENGRIAEITTFPPGLLPAFGLSATL